MARNYRNSNYRASRSTNRKSASSFGGGKWVILGIIIGLAAAGAYLHYQSTQIGKSSQPTHSIKQQTSLPVKTPAISTKPPVNAPQQTQTNQPGNTPQAPEFDFYTVLPKMQVPATNTNKTQTSAPTPSPSPAPAINPPSNTAVTPPSTQVTVPPANAPTAAATNAQTPAVSQLPPIRPAPPTPTIPTPPASRPANERYVLQVASLAKYGDADQLKAQLTMLGFEVSVQKFPANGQTWYRVLAGSYSSREAALKQQAALKQNNISSILIKQP